jgi:hypothetical protein
LLPKNGVLDQKVLPVTGQIDDSTSSERDGGWFGPFHDCVFGVVEDRFAGIDDSRKHDDLYSILSDLRWSGIINESVAKDMSEAGKQRG